MVIQPRLIRLRDAPNYLGMDKNRFNKEVKPCLSIVPIGKRGIAFDRLDLDAWVDDYKKHKGRPPLKDMQIWKRESQGSLITRKFGKPTEESTAVAFQKALDKVLSKKPRRTSK